MRDSSSAIAFNLASPSKKPPYMVRALHDIFDLSAEFWCQLLHAGSIASGGVLNKAKSERAQNFAPSITHTEPRLS